MEELNQLRIKARTWKLLLYGSIVAFFAALIRFLVFLSKAENGEVGVLAVFFALPTAYTHAKLKKSEKAYREAFRQTLVPRLLRRKFTDLDYEPGLLTHQQAIHYARAKMQDTRQVSGWGFNNYGARMQEFYAYVCEYHPPEHSAEQALLTMERAAAYILRDTGSFMLPGCRLRAENYISGQYNRHSVACSDYRIVRIQQGKGSTHEKTVARGRWMIFDLSKACRGVVQVYQKGFSCAGYGKAWTDQGVNGKHSIKLEAWGQSIHTQNPSFDQTFQVYAQYRQEAAEILIPALLSRMQSLAERGEGKLMFAFVGDKLHVLLDSRAASFQPGSVFQPLDEEQVTQRLWDDILDITQFIDALSLDNDLFVQEG